MLPNGIAIVFVSCLAFIHGEDPGVPHQQYLKAFENLPALFEHIIDMLHDKPEILEKNDVTTFLVAAASEDSSPWEDGFIFKREVKFDDGILKGDSDFGGFAGSNGLGDFQLTAEEVAERMFMAERKLEEYHNETN